MQTCNWPGRDSNSDSIKQLLPTVQEHDLKLHWIKLATDVKNKAFVNLNKIILNCLVKKIVSIKIY